MSDGAPDTKVIEMREHAIAVLYKEVQQDEAAHARAGAALDEKRRRLGRLFTEQRATFGKRGDGFVAWCKERGYEHATVNRLMKFSCSTVEHDYTTARKAAEPSSRSEARKQAKQKTQKQKEADNEYRKESVRLASQVKTAAEKLGKTPAQVLKDLEREQIDRRREEREERQAQRERDRLRDEEELRALKEGWTHRGQPQAKVDLAFAIVAAGYRALSMKTHPDKGGSSAAQHQLTEARDWLVAILKNPTLVSTLTMFSGNKKP